MSLILLGEYRNQNSNRVYPFADDATLTDRSGASLPADLLIDAFLYPIDINDAVYLHSIDTAANKIYFASRDVSEPFGVATYTAGSDTTYVYETGEYERQIGVLVFGDGLSAILGGSVLRVFDYAATALCPTAYIPVNQDGVRGILLDDGSFITGEITISGGDGVDITTAADVVDGYLVIDFIGTLPPSPDECADVCPVIQEICIEREPGSIFSLSEYGTNGISISGYGITQDDLCQAQRELRLPDDTGALPPHATQSTPCDPTPPPDPPDPGEEQAFCVSIGSAGGTLIIVTPSTPSMLNPILVAGVRGASNSFSFLQSHPVASLTDLNSEITKATDPPASADSIKIAVKGLSDYRRRSK